ncbi:MAG: hypothetical protein ACI4M0_04040 [Christensenellales bacterium]
MKRSIIFSLVLLIAVAVFFALFATPETAFADDSATSTPSWVRIVDNDTWLLKNASDSASDKLFKLAYSYYLKVTDVTQSGFYRVELMENSGGFVKIYGYVKCDKVSAVVDQPTYPTYPTVIVTVKQSNTILFSQPSSTSQSVCAVYDGQVLYYYGAYPVADSTWFFVRYDQNLCYVNSDGVSAPAISLHPTPITTAADVNPVQPTPEEPDHSDQPIQQEPAAQSSDSLSKMQIAIIALVCIPAIIIVVVLFLPAKSKKQKYYTTDSAAADLPTESPGQPSQQPRYFDDFL